MISENIVKSRGGGGVMRAGAVIRSNTVSFHLPFTVLRFALIFRILQWNCGKYPSCGWRINFTYDYIALLFSLAFSPSLEQEPYKAVMRKACCVIISDAWRGKMFHLCIQNISLKRLNVIIIVKRAYLERDIDL